jgi:FkbM family methyltransferase
MAFQTVFYNAITGKILKTIPNKYIQSKYHKIECCPEAKTININFTYFFSITEIDLVQHRVKYLTEKKLPIVVDLYDIPVIFYAKKDPFLKAIAHNKNIIVDFADGMGDKLYRAAAVIEAQKVYPDINFFCKIDPAYLGVMTLIPGLNIFTDPTIGKVKGDDCALIEMTARDLAKPIDNRFPAPTRYGLFLGLTKTPYDIQFVLPDNFNSAQIDFSKRINWREDGKNIVMQLRTKDFAGRSWSQDNIKKLASILKEIDDYNIYYLGKASDLQDSGPDIINLCGKTSWLETLWMLKNAKMNFVIDSSNLHLCKALNSSYICLWGQTDPQDVIDRPPQPYDLGVSMTDRRSPADKITPQQAASRFIELISGAAAVIDTTKETKYPKPTANNDKSSKKEVSTAISGDKNANLENSPGVIDNTANIQDFSQHGAQKIILRYFEDHPPIHRKLVDVGAYGADMSNSIALLMQGWSGLLIEPNPLRIGIMKQKFSGLDAKILNIGIAPAAGCLSYYLHSVPGHNSFLADWYPATKTGKTKRIKVERLPGVLFANNIPFDFDFLSIDTEGMDAQIMFDFFSTSKYRPRMIITEANSYTGDTTMFTAEGYHLLEFVGPPDYGNYIFIKEG